MHKSTRSPLISLYPSLNLRQSVLITEEDSRSTCVYTSLYTNNHPSAIQTQPTPARVAFSGKAYSVYSHNVVITIGINFGQKQYKQMETYPDGNISEGGKGEGSERNMMS